MTTEAAAISICISMILVIIIIIIITIIIIAFVILILILLRQCLQVRRKLRLPGCHLGVNSRWEKKTPWIWPSDFLGILNPKPEKMWMALQTGVPCGVLFVYKGACRIWISGFGSSALRAFDVAGFTLRALRQKTSRVSRALGFGVYWFRGLGV